MDKIFCNNCHRSLDVESGTVVKAQRGEEGITITFCSKICRDQYMAEWKKYNESRRQGARIKRNA